MKVNLITKSDNSNENDIKRQKIEINDKLKMANDKKII
jgi:hypothetical protein